MAEENGVFSDDDLDLDHGTNGGGSVLTSSPTKEKIEASPQPKVTLRKLVLKKPTKIQAVQRIHDLTSERHSRSCSPTPSSTSNSNGLGLSSRPTGMPVPLSFVSPTNNGISENQNGTSFTNGTSFQSRNTLYSLVPNPIPTNHDGDRSLPPRQDRRNNSFSSTTSAYFRFFSLIIILTLIYTLINSSIIGEFRQELRETMNNYQMHLINLQSLHRMESKEGKEREKRLFAKTAKIESVLLDLRKVIHSPSNYLGGISAFGQPMDFPLSSYEKKESLLTLLEEIRSESPKQTRDTFVQLLTIIGDTFNDAETRPACIVLLIPPNTQSTSFPSCFGRKVANGLNKIFSGPTYQVNAKELSIQDLLDVPDITTIHNDLKSYFTYEGGKAVLIQDVEQIQSYDMLLLLHAFCDNTMAYDTTATFIFTLNVPQAVYDEHQWLEHNGLRMTHDTLMAAWDNVLTLDKIPALISRIAVANILIRDGDTC